MREVAPGVIEHGNPGTPAPAVPTVEMWQVRRALLDAGKLEAAEAAINALPEPAKSQALIKYEYKTHVMRDSSLVAAIGAACGLSPSDIDALFAYAATLT